MFDDHSVYRLGFLFTVICSFGDDDIAISAAAAGRRARGASRQQPIASSPISSPHMSKHASGSGAPTLASVIQWLDGGDAGVAQRPSSFPPKTAQQQQQQQMQSHQKQMLLQELRSRQSSGGSPTTVPFLPSPPHTSSSPKTTASPLQFAASPPSTMTETEAVGGGESRADMLAAKVSKGDGLWCEV